MDYEKLRQLAEQASRGRWRTKLCGDKDCWCREVESDDELAKAQGAVISAGAVFKNDAEFIAAANPQVVLALLDELEALKGFIASGEAVLRITSGPYKNYVYSEEERQELVLKMAKLFSSKTKGGVK